ncbi:MAG TPA: serine/threonine-protein kinase [Gemmatimonadaceae bacterium]
MNDLLLPARLQAALGDAYLLERELGGGGMSRLFVATERSLNRQVVIKVLPPELASEVSGARFKKEIEVAAQMLHPHIVPILVAGSGDGLLWYVMPYVRGESLRHRLREGGALPVREAIKILIEVADALAFAHRKGIVHRDIKPENILLEEGHAVLADFGVARAISAARTASAVDGANLTGTGMSVGTPTYMSPEQAAGESDIDARADIYALGIVGYEMLAGRHPFSGSGSVQSMIVAHLTEPAPPVAKLRADTPPAVNAAIARALAKLPDERFRTAEEFRDALDAAPSSARGSRGPLLAIGAAVVAMLVVVGIVATRRQHTGPLDQNLVAVAPFDVVDADLKLWHEGMVDVLSRNLDGAGPLRTVSPTLVVRRWAGRADKESAAALGKATGARLAVFGRLIRSGADSVRASASVVDVSTGRVLGDVERRDALSSMDRLSDSLTIGLLRELGKTRALGGAQMSSVGTTSLPALKAFLEGQQYFRRSAWDSAVASYDRAIEIDSTFSIALMHDGMSRGWVGGTADSGAISLMQRGARYNHGLAPRDSLLVQATAQFATLGASENSGPPFTVQRALFATLHEAVRRYPTDPELWYALGDAQYHWGWGPEIGVTERDVVRSFDRAIALDSAFTPAYIHAIEMAFRYGTANGRRYLAAYLAQNPTEVDAEGMRLASRLTDPALAGTPETREMLDTASADQLQHAAAAVVEWGDSAGTFLRLVRPIASGRHYHDPSFADTMRLKRRLPYALASRGLGAEAMKIKPTGDLLLKLALLGAAPSSVADSVLREDVGRGRICLPCAASYWGMRGDTTKLQLMNKMADSLVRDPHSKDDRLRIPYLLDLDRAYITLARHDTTQALQQFSALPDSLCHACGWAVLTQAQLLESRGRNAEAAAILDELSVFNDLLGTLAELERGRIAEKLGDKPRARDAYSFVADIWQRGDPAFQVYVSEARAGLKRMNEESGGTAIPVRKP